MSARGGTLYWLPRILDDERLDAVETLLLVALADYVDANDEAFPSIELLAARARCSYPTARRRLSSLTERGIIERERRRRQSGNLSTYTYRLLRGDDALPLNLSGGDDGPVITQESGSHRSPGRALATDHQGARAEPPREEPPNENLRDVSLPLDDERVPEPSKPEDPTKARARQIVERVWERSDPKPATPFIGCVKVAEALLRAGHDPQDIGRAMLAVPTISIRWVESEIKRSKPAAARRDPIDTNREGPEGRIDL